ncbi:MAG: taurine catabolism dioxygenase [Proteobacteria bacterium]|nr:taurine catabolism dioxygenase [Pseudomonadota bacterium]
MKSYSPVPHDPRAVFALDDARAYAAWREEKLDDYPRTAQQLVVEIDDPRQLSPAEYQEILRVCGKANMAIYACRRAAAMDKDALRRLGEQFGLHRLDGNLCADEDSISSLRVMAEGRQQEYIPYTNKPLNWHTDGYYNTPEQRIRAFIIHCASSAASGGGNALLDCEIAYIQLRDANPDYVAALMQGDALTIPPNIEAGVEIRPEQSGPVFSLDPQGLGLHMRYTIRKRHIQWRQDAITLAAVAHLEALLNGPTASPYIFSHRLEAGQGILCNNVLHNRAGFTDDPSNGRQRLMYRARYYDRIACGPWLENAAPQPHMKDPSSVSIP